jgi:hypothetical protein
VTIASTAMGCSGCHSKGTNIGYRPDANADGRQDVIPLDHGLDAAPTSDAPDSSVRMIIAMDPGAPTDLALDQDYVYWTSYSSGTIQRVPKAGGSSQLLTQIQKDGLPTLDVDDTTVYFAAYDDTGVTTYVGSIPKTGGPITVLAPLQMAALRVKVRNGFVYWLADSQSNVGGVVRVPVTGGAVQALTPSTYIGTARLAVDDQYAYWTAYGDLGATSGNVYRVPCDGSGPVATLVAGVDSPYGIVVDASDLFVGLGFHPNVTNGSVNGGVLSLNRLGAPPVPTTVIASNQGQPLAVAIDDTFVYWGDHLTGYIMKAPKAGGPAVPIVSGDGSFESIAVDDQYVYWIFGSVGNGYVARAPKSP